MDSQEVEISHETSDGLLTVRVSGPVDIESLTKYTTLHQKEWAKHARVLWDLREAEASKLTSEDILNIRHSFADIIELRAGGRSAVLTSQNVELIAKIAIALVEANQAPIEFEAFLDEAEALAWLNAS